jgi:hypothetical protein
MAPPAAIPFHEDDSVSKAGEKPVDDIRLAARRRGHASIILSALSCERG